jgi:hypothetical protein
MSYQEEEQSRLRRQSSKQAIALAMQGRWREAIAVNQSLIEMFPTDVDAYNRLGRAHMELGDYDQANEAYSRSLEIDPYNTIARKNLDRLSHLKETAVGSKDDSHQLEPEQFIEEVGKAGAVQLYKLAPPAVLARMVAGDRVNLKIDGTNLVVESNRGEYLGLVEPGHAQRLIRLMEGGNKYSAVVVRSSEAATTLIIRETYQDPGQVGRLSFPSRRLEGIRANVGDRVIRRELEHEESLLGEPGYTVIGGNETTVLTDESVEGNDEDENEE